MCLNTKADALGYDKQKSNFKTNGMWLKLHAEEN